jgi:hypothetical protein
VAVDILIDKLTDCLIERESDTVMETEYRKRLFPITKEEFKGWIFDWSKTEKQGYSIYELFLKGDEEVQGRISLRIDGGVADVDIVETAPHNYGHTGKYIGVGGHMFAIACQCSLEAGCDGVVAFTSKSNLVEHYKHELNAVEIMPRRMVIFEDAAQLLLDKYIRK